MVPKVITFLTDFGCDDVYVGVVKGVMLGINRRAQIVDLTHAVRAYDVREGAYLLMTAVDYVPPDAVHLAVVDPGVGTTRRAIAVQAGDTAFVGPDNGLLSWSLLYLARAGRIAARAEGEQLVLGAGVRAVELTDDRWWRTPVSRTFHARDLFGPVAAHLSVGVRLDELGTPLDRIALIPFPEPVVRPDGVVEGEVVHVDRFGNLITNLPGDKLTPSTVFIIGNRRIAGLTPTFGAGQGLIALVGSSGFVEIAVTRGSAADELGAGPGAPIRAEPGRS